MRISIPIVNLSWHGGTRVLVQIANHLAAEGHEVFILSLRVSTPFSISRRVRIRRVGVKTPWRALDYLSFLVLLPFRVPRRSVLVATFFVTYYSVRIAAALRRLPYLYFVQDIESKYAGWRGRALNALCNLTYRDKRIVAANPYLREVLEERFRCASRSIDIGPAEVFYGRPASTSKQFDVIYFPRKERWKGLDRFHRFLAASGARLRCLCVAQNEALFRSVEHPAVTCRKPANDEELIDCIDSARVLFLTSYHEGFSLPPLEGMARGVPPVLFRCGGPELYVQDRLNGIYVESAEQAVEEIAALLRDEQRYAELRRGAISTAARYKMERGLRQFSDRIAECAGTPA